MPDKKLAAKVVLEIIRQSAGDEIEGKLRLFKAFYFAHLFYAHAAVDYLTDWPIVRMPQGPGIDQFESLLGELVDSGSVESTPTRVGPYPSTIYHATGNPYVDAELSEAALDAVRKSAEFISDKTGAQLSDITHDYSRTWNEADDGEELSIYLDLLSDDDYQAAVQKSKDVADEIASAWQR